MACSAGNTRVMQNVTPVARACQAALPTPDDAMPCQHQMMPCLANAR